MRCQVYLYCGSLWLFLILSFNILIYTQPGVLTGAVPLFSTQPHTDITIYAQYDRGYHEFSRNKLAASSIISSSRLRSPFTAWIVVPRSCCDIRMSFHVLASRLTKLSVLQPEYPFRNNSLVQGSICHSRGYPR
jgi:hypothetical protein